MYVKNSYSEYRQRGYKCKVCQMHTMVFGGTAEPDTCVKCQSEGSFVKEWDHVVKQTVEVSDYMVDTK